MATAQAAHLGLPPRSKPTHWQPQKSRFLPTLQMVHCIFIFLTLDFGRDEKRQILTDI